MYQKKMGRKSHKDELNHIKLLMQCESILRNALSSAKVKPAEKRHIALELYKKGMPASIDFSGTMTLQYEHMTDAQLLDYTSKRNIPLPDRIARAVEYNTAN